MIARKWSICAAALAGALLASAAMAQDAVDKVRQTQSRLLAKRAAQADAYRNLAEQVKGLRISSSTFVRDFVAENDEIQTAVNTFLRGAKVVNVQYFEDDSAEVTMELPLKIVETELTRVYTAHYKGDKYKINDFQDLHVTNKIEKITVTGSGAPRSIAVEEFDDEGRPAGGDTRRSLSLPPEWKEIPPQARLMAKRAAQVDAYRNLAEQVMGLQIRSNTYVRDFVAENDEIETNLRTFLRGAKIAEVRYLADLSVEMDVKLPLQTVITELTREYEAHYKGDKFKARDFQDIKQRTEISWVTATGTGLPPEKYLTGRKPIGVRPPAGPQAPDWVRNTVKATGNAVRPANAESDAQGKLMALRGAKLDAMRNLSEQINGLVIDSRTKVRDFVAENDEIRTAMNDYLRGVRTVSEKYDPASGEAEVTVEAPLEALWNIVVKYRSVRVETRN